MLFTPHILTGAAIGSQIPSFGLVFILSVISHFILDSFPHWQYENEGLEGKVNKKFLLDGLRVALDATFVFAILFLFFRENPNFVYMLWGGLAAIVPDILIFLSWKTNVQFLKKLSRFHEKTVHLFEHEKSPNFQGLFWQISFSLISFFLILFL